MFFILANVSEQCEVWNTTNEKLDNDDREGGFGVSDGLLDFIYKTDGSLLRRRAT